MKRAIVVVSVGTTYQVTIERDIALSERKIAEAFKTYDFYRAFTSETIIEQLEMRRDMKVHHIKEVLQHLFKNEYEEVVIQPLFLICGDTYKELKAQLALYHFKKLVIGAPLLVDEEDYEVVNKVVMSKVPQIEDGEALVLMGHGTTHMAHKVYRKVEELLQQEKIPAYLATLKGNPSIQDIIEPLKIANVKKVYLMPFLLTAGGHTLKEMAGDHKAAWQFILTEAGFDVEVILSGLGENEAIAHRFLEHVKMAIKRKWQEETMHCS